MPRGNDINAIPTYCAGDTVTVLLPKNERSSTDIHVCCAMLMKLDMISTSYSKLLVNFVCQSSYLKLSGHGLCCLEV